MGKADPQDWLPRLKRVRDDPMEFLRYVKTRDEVDRTMPVKPFPVHLDYIRLYTRIWQRELYVAVPKSRRMIMTWTNVALYTWDALYHEGQSFAFVSKKEDDADELVQRSRFIVENLDMPREFIPRLEYKYAFLRFPELNSQIRGFPQGADQLRQFTFSGILADEIAFWADAQKMYASSMPTLEGGGRFTAISSPAPGFFKRLVFDQLDQEVQE